MKLQFSDNDKVTVSLKDLSYGKLFLYGSYLYMKIFNKCDGFCLEPIDKHYMVCNVKSGTLRLISKNTRVIPYKATLPTKNMALSTYSWSKLRDGDIVIQNQDILMKVKKQCTGVPNIIKDNNLLFLHMRSGTLKLIDVKECSSISVWSNAEMKSIMRDPTHNISPRKEHEVRI